MSKWRAGFSLSGQRGEDLGVPMLWGVRGDSLLPAVVWLIPSSGKPAPFGSTSENPPHRGARIESMAPDETYAIVGRGLRRLGFILRFLGRIRKVPRPPSWRFQFAEADGLRPKDADGRGAVSESSACPVSAQRPGWRLAKRCNRLRRDQRRHRAKRPGTRSAASVA